MWYSHLTFINVHVKLILQTITYCMYISKKKLIIVSNKKTI